MKFARYLQDTQTPEWKKAYIDYRALKVQLGIIRAQDAQQTYPSTSLGPTNANQSAANNEGGQDHPQEPQLDSGISTSAQVGGPWVSGTEPATDTTRNVIIHSPAAVPVRRRTSNQERPPLKLALSSLQLHLPHRLVGSTSNAPSQQTPLAPRTPRASVLFPFFRDSGASFAPLSLRVILANLPPSHATFFDMLNTELEKVETFYAEREKEMHERAQQLKEQLNELELHRHMFYQLSTQSRDQPWVKKARLPAASRLSSWMQWLYGPDTESTSAVGMLASESGRGGRRGVIDTSTLGLRSGGHERRGSQRSKSKQEGAATDGAEKDLDANAPSSSKPLDGAVKPSVGRSNSMKTTKNPLDPHEYLHAKRRLRRAVIEHYRGLEVLNNYRILNVTGFRKALKKYEKITKNPVLDAYMKEKVEPSAFFNGTIVSTMLKEAEDLYAAKFERGDRKKAMSRLRVGPFVKTHHFSTFRSGMWLGLALPALALGTYLSFLQDTRDALPSWDILLFIYSVLFLPVLMALLIGTNITVWAHEKINYVFIFDLNPRSRLDHHEFFELPSFFICAIAYAYWLSFSQIGPPMLWPLVWVGLAIMIMFNPMRSVLWGRARFWLLKKTAKLFVSGVWKVEFMDFWLGDQFCSLVYSLSNVFFIGCFYTSSFSNFYSRLSTPQLTSFPATKSPIENAFQGLVSSAYDPHVQDVWPLCGVGRNWGWYFVLATSPFMVRFVQSVRRYRDSKLPTHLINAGKYGIGIIYYFFYYYWRHQGDPHVGPSYILWCFTACVYTLYSSAWDFLMDWSMFKPHARYPLLRPELIYKSRIPVSNVGIRFLWLTYIPAKPSAMTLQTFIVGTLEVLRRVQWNFFRLENEHLGNVDQYRVTREVPLPYDFSVEEEEEREQDPNADTEQERDEDENEGEEGNAGQDRRGGGLSRWVPRRVGRGRRGHAHG
ncbi:EXS family protein/ERD1/XPR1/SYG1 family protein [Chiua virens]|nr:EXS family protein/ERD1/XPR1/SYG1 family protein [Chiua virens]